MGIQCNEGIDYRLLLCMCRCTDRLLGWHDDESHVMFGD